MIDPVDFQTFLLKIEGGAAAVDLLKIGQNHYPHHTSNLNKIKHNGNFRVALDMEDCLDRFYGGYYSDWACGGQWNRAYQFVQLLANAFKNAHVEVIAFFDGTLKKNKKLTAERKEFRQKTISVLKHIRMIATPPPKIWWLPPSGIRTTIRNALRSVNIQVTQTVNDHTMEIIEYFHEQKLDGILGLHPDYIIANCARYFSSHDLRLSYKGSLETKEFMVSKLLTALSLTADHLPFVAVFLGGYILIDETMLKKIHERFKIDGSLDFEARIRKIAEIVRNSPTNDIDEFIKHLDLGEFDKHIKESVEYYQRKGKFANKKYLGNKKRSGVDKIPVVEPAVLASETNENDEAAKKILNKVSNMSGDEIGSTSSDAAGGSDSNKQNSAKDANSPAPFVYTLPGEVLKTSLNRHQRGVMDARIYQLLTKKEVILPQILEDEQYREIPSVHLFYRPARQMIYAILFNLYHQKYLCSKQNASTSSGQDKKTERGKRDSNRTPEIKIAEWIWSPQNEYKKPEYVSAHLLPWAVPTIQRLWFGTALEDKQRRMKAFLTIMRSDSPLMLNRGYVPQHMLVMACVLRYIITSPDRNILTQQELDAFLATAFSPQLPQVEYTQELVLLGVNLRGVYLATLFMQGVETAALANDSCGVPLPWTMTNPWLFFDGKLFHLKLKMASCVSTLRELCDDHIEIVLKIERFRKAILEDVEHFLLPAAHIDPVYRPGFLQPPTLPVAAYNNRGLHQLATAAANANGTIFYNPQAQLPAPPYFSPSAALLNRNGLPGLASAALVNNRNQNRTNNNQRPNAVNNRRGYQLKVGGIVTGSWAPGGIGNRSLLGPPSNRLVNRTIASLAAAVNNRRRTSVNARLQRNQQVITAPTNNGMTSRSITRAYGNKLNVRNRAKPKRKDNRKTKQQSGTPTKKESNDEPATEKKEVQGTSETKTDMENILKKIKNTTIRECTVELQNGSTVLASDLANSMCDEILKEEEDVKKVDENDIKIKSPTTSPTKPSTKSDSTDDTANVASKTDGDTVSNKSVAPAVTNDNGTVPKSTGISKVATTNNTKKAKTKKNGTNKLVDNAGENSDEIVQSADAAPVKVTLEV